MTKEIIKNKIMEFDDKNLFPSLENNQVALVRADFFTGHILDKDYNLYNVSKECEIYTIFDSIDLAKLYICKQKLKYENIEYIIYGKTKEVLCYIEPR
ncbi:MAG: hypothetical protein LBU84_10015 [Prevotella sp.]|jgi:hypothetical protein|nr:hypothetical protein [Prevotella sp.]